MKRLFLLTSLLINGVFTTPALTAESSSCYTLEKFCEILQEMGIPDENQKYSFSWDERDTVINAGKKSWATYKQHYGVENVKIKFPRPPKISHEKGVVYTYSNRKDVQYTMVAGMPPIGGIKPREAFPIAIASLCQHPNKLMDYHISKSDGLNVLDTISEDFENELVTKSRMIITPRNFYILRTRYYIGDREDHDYFVDSLSICR